MSLGYSHDTHFLLPKEVTATAVTEKKGNPIVTFKSIDKQLIGQVAAKLRRCASRSRTRARVSSSSASRSVARPVNQQVLNSK